MRKIHVLIVEDEMIVARDIAYYLEKLGCNVMGILVEGEEVLPTIKIKQPDIIFMDINLKGNLDGVETIHLVNKEYDIPVIFLTANTDDQSFELAKATKPYAFVEKPFKPKRLVRTVELLIEQILTETTESESGDDDQVILSDRIFVRDKGRMTKIFLADILYIEADGAYSKIVCDGKSFLLAANLSSLESKITSATLMRVHRSFIVNLEKVESIEENYIHLGRRTISVSRAHWKDFLSKVNVI